MDKNYYINHKTISRLPEEILSKFLLAQPKLDYKQIIEKSVDELKKNKNDHLKWKQELSETEKRSALSVFSVYGFSDMDVITFVTDRDGDICLFTKNTLYLGKRNKYEAHYYVIPLDKIGEYGEKRTGNDEYIWITFDDGKEITMPENQCSGIPKEFLKVYTKNLFKVKTEIERTESIAKESQDTRERMRRLEYAIQKINKKYGNDIIKYGKDKTVNSYFAYMMIGQNRKIYFTEQSILLQNAFGQKDIDLKKLVKIEKDKQYSLWFVLEYQNGRKEEITFGVEKTKIMYDFFNFYLEKDSDEQ